MQPPAALDLICAFAPIVSVVRQDVGDQLVDASVVARNVGLCFYLRQSPLQQLLSVFVVRAAAAFAARYATVVKLNPPYPTPVLKDRAAAACSLGNILGNSSNHRARRFHFGVSARVELGLLTLPCLLHRAH